MTKSHHQISLVYPFLITLLFVGLIPLIIIGWLLSGRSEMELRAVEGRYQAQIVQDKARQIDMFGRSYRDLITQLAHAFELSGGTEVLEHEGTEAHLRQTLKEHPDLLALIIKPVNGKPYTAFRPELKTEEIEKFTEQVLSQFDEARLVVNRPQSINSGRDLGMAIGAPIIKNNEVTAAVIGIVACREISLIVEQSMLGNEKELLEAGLPVVFVVDKDGKTIAHPDATFVLEQHSFADLKVVQDWQEAGQKVQSALSPFIIEREGKQEKMLGSYATVELSSNTILGVIAIQNEKAALASVAEMRNQIWYISLFASFLAIVLGIVFAKTLTNPVRDLVQAAERISEGDFSERIEVRSRTEIGTLGRVFNSMTDRIEHYIADLQHAAQENREMFLGTVKSLAAAIDGKDPYTRGHSERVSRISVAIGQRLNLPEDELEKLRISALLHDVGKIGIDDAILKKPAALTDEEFEIMKQHPQKGYKIMAQIPLMKDFLPGMYMHHEMLNGMGYPQGLKGDEIPMQARIVSVADTFDAMTIDRPYSKAMTLEQAIERIRSFIGTRYDVRVVEALAQAVADGQIKAGSVRIKINDSLKFHVRAPKPQVQATE
jgi:HD-GYP domain-containing protein (c-di-GMP phosphodiesterase class II)